jgi:putative DeoR family transcriptional regulator (stage III sporulation protein D)
LLKGLLSEELEKRILEHGELVASGKTVRQVADKTGWSKTTVDEDVAKRLEKVNPSLAKEARKVLDVNYSERCIRGGKASQAKNGCNFLKKKKAEKAVV